MIFSPIALVLCFFLGRFFGAYGALAGLLISQGMLRAYCIHYIHSSTGWKLRDFLPLTHMSVFTGVSLVFAVVCLLLRSHFTEVFAGS